MNRLKCPDCSDYRSLVIKFVRFEKNNKGVDYNVPFFECSTCGNSEPLNALEEWEEIAEKDSQKLSKGEYVKMDFDYENKRFEQYDHLGLKYDSADLYLIPGLETPVDDGYLTPVFFDKDLLLYYNNHPDYSVRLFSFSSGNIFYKDSPLFSWGFGINRNGKIFKWLGDLNQDLSDKKMESHLRRFQASNVESDHDIYSKFYLSQIPFSLEDAFQTSDNEYKVFDLKRKFETTLKFKFNMNFSKLDVQNLSSYYRQPILEDRPQIFSAYLSLNIYLIENIQQDELKRILRDKGLSEKDIKIGSLKLFEIFLNIVLCVDLYSSLLLPLFVLNDLRQLHGHLTVDSFDSKYKFCKDRLGLESVSSDFNVYLELNKKLIEMYEKLNVAADNL